MATTATTAIITVVAAIIIAAVALFLAVTLLTPKAEGDLTGTMDPTEPSVPVEDTPAVSIEPVETGPIKTYDNGVATITYDSNGLANNAAV